MADLTASGPGIQRVAESVLRAAGGEAVLLRMPVAGVAGVVAEQLGLVAATFADSELAPVVLRETSAGAGEAGERWELLVGGSAVAGLAGDATVASALGLFAQALGVVKDGVLLRIETVSYRTVGTAVYLYRVELRESSGSVV